MTQKFEMVSPFKEHYDVVPTHSSKTNAFVTSSKVLAVTLVRQLRGGLSGDNVMLIRINDSKKLYLLKVFKSVDKKKFDKNMNEITAHLKFMDMFDKEFMPCPAIYAFGTLSDKPFAMGLQKYQRAQSHEDGNILFVIMEALNPPYELFEFVESLCLKKRPMYYIDLKDVLLQLFFILSIMTLNNTLHCDLHAKNIMIVPAEYDVTADLRSIGLPGKFKFGAYHVKIIDFGEASSIICRLQRTTTKGLDDLKSVCGGKRDIGAFLKGTVSNAASPTRGINPLKKIKSLFSERSNVDMNFFSRLIEIMGTVDRRIARVDTGKIRKLSEILFDVQMQMEKGILGKITHRDIIREIYLTLDL